MPSSGLATIRNPSGFARWAVLPLAARAPPVNSAPGAFGRTTPRAARSRRIPPPRPLRAKPQTRKCGRDDARSPRVLGARAMRSAKDHPDVSPLSARASPPLKGRARVPGDKSISHRALILSALAVGETRITGLLEGEDVLHTANAIRALGASVERTGEGRWRVHGVGVAGFAESEAPLDLGNSGTGC